MDNFESLDWQVENLRLTAFPSPSVQFDPETNWWTELMGTPPETSLHRARQGVSRQEGDLDDKRLILTIQPDRINWLLAAQIEAQTGLPVIGSLDESLKIFLPLMLRWFEFHTCPPLSRLAFGTILLSSVDTKKSGYQQLNRLLPAVELDIEGISDFSYQINRPRDSITQVSGLKINRLSKWSVITLRQFNLIVSQVSMKPSEKHEVIACRLELDINTHQDFNGELLPEQLPEVFNELVDLAKEVATEGDVG